MWIFKSAREKIIPYSQYFDLRNLIENMEQLQFHFIDGGKNAYSTSMQSYANMQPENLKTTFESLRALGKEKIPIDKELQVHIHSLYKKFEELRPIQESISKSRSNAKNLREQATKSETNFGKVDKELQNARSSGNQSKINKAETNYNVAKATAEQNEEAARRAEEALQSEEEKYSEDFMNILTRDLDSLIEGHLRCYEQLNNLTPRFSSISSSFTEEFDPQLDELKRTLEEIEQQTID